MDPYGERRKFDLSPLRKKGRDLKVQQRKGSKEEDGSFQLMQRFINCSAENGQSDLRDRNN